MFKQRPILRIIFVIIKYGITSFAVFLVAFVILYFAWLREWQLTWGATAKDICRYMPGDELVENPSFNATRAVKIKASPEQVWPWLVQIGYKRAGFYSYDKLDNDGVRSSDVINPEYQNLKAGDSIPLGENIHLKVLSMEPNKSMLWVFQAGPWRNTTWSWGLYEADSEHTQLVSRLRVKYKMDSLQKIIAWSFIDVFEIIMMRKCLLGIKERVEATAGSL